MSERMKGWYWVVANGDWEPSYYNGVDWSGMDDEDFEQIGPRIPTPSEPWQTVPKEPDDEMTEAGEEAFGNPNECNKDDCRVIYRAMLKAAPSPGQEE